MERRRRHVEHGTDQRDLRSGMKMRRDHEAEVRHGRVGHRRMISFWRWRTDRPQDRMTAGRT